MIRRFVKRMVLFLDLCNSLRRALATIQRLALSQSIQNNTTVSLAEIMKLYVLTMLSKAGLTFATDSRGFDFVELDRHRLACAKVVE